MTRVTLGKSRVREIRPPGSVRAKAEWLSYSTTIPQGIGSLDAAGCSLFRISADWARQVAYASQFMTPVDRAHRGKARINSRLCAVGGFDPDEWEFPPKPKWMRWRTYQRAEDRFNAHEAALDRGTFELLAKFMARYP